MKICVQWDSNLQSSDSKGDVFPTEPTRHVKSCSKLLLYPFFSRNEKNAGTPSPPCARAVQNYTNKQTPECESTFCTVLAVVDQGPEHGQPRTIIFKQNRNEFVFRSKFESNNDGTLCVEFFFFLNAQKILQPQQQQGPLV